MKLRTEKGKWILTDRERTIDFNKCGTAAWGYVLLMKDIRGVSNSITQLYPVKSLVPHPKKRRLTKKWRARIKNIKRRFEMGMHEREEGNLCVCCGEVVPEGRQVCIKCERGAIR